MEVRTELSGLGLRKLRFGMMGDRGNEVQGTY